MANGSLTPEIQDQFNKNFWATLGQPGVDILSARDVADRGIPQLDNADNYVQLSTTLRNNVNRNVLSLGANDLKALANEELNKIYQARATDHKGDAQYQRFNELVWWNVANGGPDKKGQSMGDAVKSAEQYWGNQNNLMGVKAEFGKYMGDNFPNLAQSAAQANDRAAVAQGYDSYADERMWQRAGINPQEKQVLDQWAQTLPKSASLPGHPGPYRNFSDYMTKAGIATFDDKFSDGRTILQTVTNQYGVGDIHTAMPLLAAAVQSRGMPHPGGGSQAPVVAQLDPQRTQQFRTDLGTTGDTSNGLNATENDKVRNLIEKGQSSANYSQYASAHHLDPRGDGVYGKGTESALSDMEIMGSLSADEVKTFHALQALGNGNANATRQQLAAVGYKIPDAQVTQANILKLQNADPKASVVVEAKIEPLAVQQPTVLDARLQELPLKSPQDVPTFDFGSTSRTATLVPASYSGRAPLRSVLPNGILNNLAVEANSGVALAGVNISHQKYDGQNVTVAKTGNIEDRVAVGPNGIFAEHIVNGQRQTMVTMDSRGRVTHNLETNNKGQLVEVGLPPNGEVPSSPNLMTFAGPSGAGEIRAAAPVSGNTQFTSAFGNVHAESAPNNRGGFDSRGTLDMAGGVTLQVSTHTERNAQRNNWVVVERQPGSTDIKLEGKGALPAPDQMMKKIEQVQQARIASNRTGLNNGI